MDSQCAGSPIARARKNLAALEALAAAEERGRATAEEIAAMEAYSGWGGAQKAFSEKAEGEWGEIRDRLKELLSEDEFASQRHTVLTAFYTPAPVIGAIYDALREAGIGQGDTPAAILEPGCGTGNFMRLAPADLALDFHGVELDPISARIAQALCPEAHITAAGLEECRVSPASFDAAIGNVPYSGDIKIDGMPIHDYFIKKSVEAVRPGGIVAVLTSRYTLDKNSTATRRALAEQAELLGAVRLPAETFRRQAGTEALSDILLLRRRSEPIALSEDELPEWVETSPFEDTVNINRYFNEHPGRAVGAMSIVSGPMGPTLGVSFKGGADALGVRVSDLLRDSVDQGGAVEMAAAQEHAGISVTPTEPTKFEFSVAADGTIWYGTEDAVEPFAPGGGKTGPERARAMLALRDGARALLALERDPAADDDEVEEAIAELSAEYDSFFERFGRINSKKNLAVFPSKGFTDHSLALNLLSLEKVNSDGEVTGKADILRKRLVTPEAPTPEHVGNPSDALATEEGLERFRDHRRRFMEAAKLAVEPADADRVASLERLESRLEAVQPVKLVPGQIACQLGSSWVPASVIRDFALETFKIGYGDAARERGSHQTAAQARGLEVRYSEVSGRWSVTSASGGMAASVAKKWGVGSYNCFMILTAALNGGLIQIEKDNPDYNPPRASPRRRSPDPVATAAANAKRRELEEAFREWAWKDEGRAAMLADIYNRKLNRVAARTYSGDYLSLPGMSPDIQLRKHQRDAVARIIQDGEGTLIAHTVGAGKTFTGITAMHELKRLGRARKPMIVVPNNLTEQWAADYLKLYPDAKLLVLTDAAAKSPDSVRRFWGQAAAGDWDAVIVGFSRFEKLQMSYGAQKAALTARIDELEESRLLELSDGADEKDFSVKQIEGVRDKFKSKLKSLEDRNASKKLEGATFEEVGCDAIFVDEAHYFKNLAVSGGSVPGMQTSDAAKCEDLLMKCEYLRGNGRGNNIVFATGTPVTNTMAELYNMQRYLSPNLLDSQGVSNFSAWAKTFGEVTETLEPKPEGGGLDIKRRFARFQNLPELMSSFHCYSDIMTADDLDLDLPELESHAVAVPATPEQLDEVEALVERGEKVHAGCDPSVDNMLKITGDGRKVALDPKLLYLEDDPDMEPLSGGKVDECVRNILDIRDRTEAERGAQLVFVDSSTPASGRWNIQDDVRRRLIEAGVPESEIACVTDAKGKSKQKEALYEKVRSGDIRILLGSTTTLGTGTNVQTRLAAIHDLACPWRPSDLEQRLGRIVRQGNTFDRVHDFRYVSTGTFDSYLYSIVERKQRFISQVFTNKSPVRTMDDLDETVLSLAQMKQIAEGDPTVAERMDVENKIGQLKLMLASHLDGLADVQHKIETQYRPLVEALTAQRDMLADDEIPFAEADLVRQQTLGSKDSFLTVGGTHIADKEEAIRALRRAAYDIRPGCEETIGTYRGLSVVCRRQRVLDDDWLPYIGLAVDAARHVHMSDRVFPSGEKGAFTVLTQMDRIIARDAKGPAEIELKLRDAQLSLADAQKAAKEPFPKQAELDEAEQRLAVLEQERIEAEAQRQREQAQRAEAEAAAIEEGVEEERAAEREHERAAVADDEAREAGRVAELRRQGLICEDSATHAAATAAPNGIASGCPNDVAEAARCSAAASAREEAGGGEKHKAGM